MTTETVQTLLIELIFGLVFVVVLIDYLRRRNPLSLALLGVFGSVAALSLAEVAEILVGTTPRWLSSAVIVLLLAQPLFALWLASQLRRVPRMVAAAALVAYLVTAVPMAVVPSPRPVFLTLAALAVFVLTDLIAASYLGLEAYRRTGAARLRLGLAAAATALFAGAVLFAAVSAATGGESPLRAAARPVALVAAVGYVFAFLPPSRLRRMSQAGPAYQLGRRLLGASGRGSDVIWAHLAESARQISGADAAAVVLAPDAEARVAAVAGALPADDSRWPRDRFEALFREPDPGAERAAASLDGIARELAERSGARLVSVVGVRDSGLAVVLLSRHHSLFAEEDRELIELLAEQAAALAEREELHAEQARLVGELEQTVEALRGASRAKSDFVASMSHELRTPLSAIIGFSQLMREEPAQDDRLLVPAEWVEHIHRSGQHLLTLINDVLDLAKVEAGRLELHPEDFSLPAVIGETVNGMRPLADRKGLRITTDVADVRVVADRGRFRQILYNLLSNAIKFTPDGGSVHVQADAGQGRFRVSVADTGVGIPPEDHETVFEEFRQIGDASARQQGTGLGLSLTRRLVEAHGGTVELESAPVRGSTFRIVLPQPKATEESEPAAVRAPSAPAPVAPEAEQADVLIIEDDPGAVRLLRTYLEGDGHAVRVASDGAMGLAEARAHVPKAILLDVLLPRLDGWEVLRQLKSDPDLRDVPVIVVTVVDERELGLALGADDYFLKPVDRGALLARLSRYSLTTKVRDRSLRVLAVDDDPGALDLVEATLRPEGFEVARANGGREALEMATAQPFDLIICDLLMPDLDGFEVVARLKSDPAMRDVPVLILTAHSLSPEEKARLNGEILSVVDKGEAAQSGLRRALARILRTASAGRAAAG